MKTLRYILGIVVFSSVSFISYGQEITGITPDLFCDDGDTVKVTIVGKRITGSDIANTALKLNGTDISANITYVKNLAGSGIDTIKAFLPLATTAGIHNLTVEKDGADGNDDDTGQIKILDPDVTISVDDNSICYNQTPVLKFNVTGTFAEPATISYTINGVSNTINSSNDGEITVPVGAIISATTYQITSIASTSIVCSNTVTGESETVTAAADINGSMSLSSSTFCPSSSSLDLIFNIANPNSANMEIFYKQGAVESSVTTSSTSATVNLSPTITNTYQLTRIKNLDVNCEKIINGPVQTVTRIAPIVATFSVADNIICVGESTNLTFSISNPNAYSLEVFYTAGGTSSSFITSGTSEVVAVTPNVSTIYGITKVSNISLNCENTITGQSLSVNVIPFPTLSFNNTGTTELCNGDGTTLKFDIGNKSNPNAPIEVEYLAGSVTKAMIVYGADTTITVTPSSTITYTLSNVKDVTSSCEQPVSGTETVTVNPVLTGTLTATTTTICNGDAVDLVFNVNNPNGDAIQIFYEENGTEKSFTTSGTVKVLNESPSTTTTYKLVRIENTTTTCTKTINGTPVTINVRNIPSASISVTGSPAICLGESTTLKFDITNKTTPNDLIKINYSAGGTLKTMTVYGADTTITVSPTVNTAYALTSVEDVFLGCASSPTSSSSIIVYPANSGTLTVSKNTICNGESVSLFFGANNPVSDNLTFYYSDGASTLTTTTTSNFASVVLNNLSTTTTFRLDSIQNITRGCVTTISNNNVRTITVNNTMGVSIAVDPTSICEGESYNIDFTITGRNSSDNVTIQYTKSNGSNINTLLSTSTATSNNISVLGTENITTLYSLVSITNMTTGCVTTYNPNASNSTQILITPSINYSISTANAVICEGTNTNLIFSVDNPNGQAITIFYSDGTNTDSITTTTTTASIIISPAISTTYTATKVKTSTCEYSLPGKFVDITVNKVPNVTISGGGTACNGSSIPIQFNITNKNTLSDLVTVQFLNAGVLQSISTTGSSVDTLVAPPTTTVYPLVSVTNNTVGCSNNNVTGSVTVTVGSGLSGDVQVSDNEICLGESLNLSLIVNGLSGTTEVVYSDGTVNDTLIVTSSTTTLTKMPTGTSITYSLVSLGDITTGCPGSTGTTSSQTVIINTLPTATLLGNTTICEKDLTGLGFDFTNGTPPYNVNYKESRMSGGVTNLGLITSVDTTIDVSPLDDATYTISNIVDSKGCTSLPISSSVNIIVDSLPTATFTLDTNFVCRGIPTNLNFTVQDNDNLDVWVKYSRLNATMSAPIIDSVLTNNTISIAVTPNITTTYKIVEIRNAITGCISPASNGNLPQTLTVYQLPQITPTVDVSTDTVCNGDNASILFNFPVGVAPFTVYFADSFATSTMRIDTGQVWTSLASGANVIQKQENNEVFQLSHRYFVKQVVDGFGCVSNFTFPQEPSVIVKIDPTPVVTLTGVQPVSQPYASTDQTPYSIQGTPKGGPLYSSFSGAGIGLTQYPMNQNYASNKFIAANAGFSDTDTIIDIFLYYTYEDAVTGCSDEVFDTARIKKALEYHFYDEGLNVLDSITIYCRNADSTYIFAKIVESDTVNVIGNNTFKLANNNGPVYSNVQSFGDSIRVTFTPLDSTGVFPLRFGSTEDGFVTIILMVIDTVNTTFSPNIDNFYFCEDSTERISLTGIPNVDVTNPNGVFTSTTLGIIDQDINGNLSDGWYLRRDQSGWHEITYTYTDAATGCVTTKVQDVEISPAPISYFQTDIECNTKSTTYFDNSTFTADVTGIDSLIQWELIYGDGATLDTTESFIKTYIYGDSDVYTATLNITSARGCSSTFDTTFVIGEIPDVDFNWIFATLGDATAFTNTSSAINNIGSAENFIDSLSWDFGDGTPLLGDTITNVSIVTHQYANIGNYQPVLYASTNNGCLDSVTTNVYILPRIGTTFPYYERFNDNTFVGGGWIADPNIAGNFWTWKNPNGVHIQHNDPTNKAWVTDLDSVYQNGKDAWVYSPTFDFTTLDKPMVAFRYWCDSRVSDGAVLQYTDDSGISWEVLGEPESGLSWYDVDNLVSQPGEQSGFDGFGWTGNDTLGGWQVARHKLDELKGKPKVRFRISFAVVPGAMTGYDGFAFDDFYVGERQKRVLVENFTHVNNILYGQVQDSVYSRIDENDLDIVMVEYHNEIPNTGVPSNDNFNLFNPADPSARSLYYQYSETGKMVVDGKVRETSNGLDLNWTQNDLDLVMLKEPIFNVSIDQFTITGNTIDVSTTIRARKPVPADLRKVYIAVVEDDLTHTGSSLIHKNVLRKLLPSAAGISLTNAWAIGTQQTVTQTWAFNPSEVNPANLKVVVWIQNSETKEVYQTAFSDFPNTLFDSTVVNTKTPLENTENMVFNLFPNPNNGNFTITFSSPMTTKTNWQLINISGQIIHQGQIATHQENVNITTNDLPKGMYFFRMYNEKGISEVRKVLVE